MKLAEIVQGDQALIEAVRPEFAARLLEEEANCNFIEVEGDDLVSMLDRMIIEAEAANGKAAK